MKLFTRGRKEQERLELLRLAAEAAENERKRAAAKLIAILDCAASATDDALGTLVGDKKNVVADKR